MAGISMVPSSSSTGLREGSSSPKRADQVFIVGMNGSGTTMLLDCLAGHSMIYGFRGETKVLPYFLARQGRYGDLTQDGNFTRLWQDLDSSVAGRDWPRGRAQASIGSWGSRPRSVAAIFDHVMKTLAAGEDKQIWCEKTPMHVHHLERLARAFPDARFIHVIRDGRDCAASFHRRWQFHPLRTAYRWKQAVRAGRKQGADLRERYFEVSYESLTANPEATLNPLCCFLGVPFEDGILRLSRLRPQMTGSSETTVAPNRRRANQYFDPALLGRIEEIAGKCLTECGYASNDVFGDRDPGAWQLRWWGALDDLHRFAGAMQRTGTLGASSRLPYLKRRVLTALSQKRSLRS